jgi:hypothetical protein
MIERMRMDIHGGLIEHQREEEVEKGEPRMFSHPMNFWRMWDLSAVIQTSN